MSAESEPTEYGHAEAASDRSDERSPEERASKMAILMKRAERILTEQLAAGKGMIRATITETFENKRIPEAMVDRYFYLLPREDHGMLFVVSDLHGDRTALRAVAQLLEEDPGIHLVSLGDAVTRSDTPGAEQAETLELLLELYTRHPDRVHLCRGNAEADVAPADGFGDALYERQGYRGFNENLARAQRLFQKLPLGFVTESGVVGLHGLPPRGIRSNPLGGDLRYRNLQEINAFSDYTDSSQFSGREVKRMLWGELGRDGKAAEGEFQAGPEGMVSGREGILKALDAIGANVLIRGHQHSLARSTGSAFSIDVDGRVGTVISHLLNHERRVASIPLDETVVRVDATMFLLVLKNPASSSVIQ